MATTIEKLTEEVFNILKGYGEKLTLFNQQGDKVSKPREASKIYCQNSGMMVSIGDYGINSSVDVSLSGNDSLKEFKDIIDTLKKVAVKYNMLFDIKKFNKQLKPKDFLFDLKESFGDSKYIDFAKEYYEKIYGKPDDEEEIVYKDEVLGFAKLIENVLSGKLKYNKYHTASNPNKIDNITYFSNDRAQIKNTLFKTFVKGIAAKIINNKTLNNFEKLFSEKLIEIYNNEVLKKDKPLEEEQIFESWFNEKYIVNENYKLIKQDEHGKNIVYESGDYYIAVDSIDNCKYVTLWYKDKKVGYLLLTEGRTSDTRGYLTVYNVQIDPKHRNKGFGKKLYEIALQFISKQYKGIGGENEQRSNKKQVPSIYKSLGGTQHKSGDYTVDKLNESEEIPETINVGGKQRPTRNSKGEYIANTEQAIVNFYKWFNDSKMVDKEGRPLVVYHGTDYEFEDFDESHLGKNHGSVSKIGFWFTDDEQYAKFHGSNIKTAYLKVYAPKIVKSTTNIKSSDKQQYDSIIQYPSKEKLGRFEVDNAGIYCVFDKNQIKSIKNLNEDVIEIPYTIEVNGKQRQTKNSENELIYPTIEGIINFWNWFGESKAIDNQARPLVLYHGSPDARFMKASPIFMSVQDRYGEKKGVGAFWFAKHRKTASTYADDRRAFDYQNAEPAIIQCYLKIENPLIVQGDGKYWREVQAIGKTTDVIEKAISSSHDGVIIKNVLDDYNNSKKTVNTDTYVVFDSLHIKSAVTNNGDFSSNSKKITESDDTPKNNDMIKIAYNNNLYTVCYLGQKDNSAFVKTKGGKIKKIPVNKLNIIQNLSQESDIVLGGDMSDNIIDKIAKKL